MTSGDVEGRSVNGGLDEPADLEPAQGSLALATDDDRHQRSEWEAAAAAVVRKARRMADDDADELVWQKLSRSTLDGIGVTPLGTPDLLDGLQTSGRPTRDGDWDIRTQPATNEEALLDLDNGATSLWLDLEPDTDLAALLEGVLLDLAPVTLRQPSAADSDQLATLLAAYDGDIDGRSNLSADPVTAEMFGHRVADDGRSPGESFVETVKRAQELGVLGAVVDGTPIHDRGASDAQELGWTMAAGAHYLRQLTDAGLSVDDAATLIEFRYAATDEQFPTIAKLRAARRLWARVLELSGAGDVPMRLHAVTSGPMMATYDPWVNMLRTTVAAFAAGVGGADSITVLPFDSRLGTPRAFGRRIARNTSSLLIAESHIARVDDPAGGSYAVEKLTDDLAVAGWAELGRIDGDGGVMSDAARAGVKERVRDVVARRDGQVAHRTRPLTGVSEFPHLGETLPERDGPGLRGVRAWGEAYEELRGGPAKQPVHLATIGPIAQHTARATFATNLLAAGGIAVTDEPGPVVCIAGTDAAYEETGAELADSLRKGGATRIIVAGKPREWADDSCATGDDAIAFLTRTREALT